MGEEEQVTEASINLKRSRADALEGKHVDTSPDKRATLAAATKTKKARVSEGAKPVVLLPPPPADLFGGGSSPNEAKDSPAAHLGRVRSFPHIEGNYPTFVYIPVYITAVDGLMPCADRLLQQFRDWLPGRQVYSISELRDESSGDVTSSRRPLELIYHVSISRTVGVRQHQIDPLIDLLRSTLTPERSFEASFGAYEVFTNDEHTRSFLSLSVVDGKSKVCSLIAKVDGVFKQFRLPTYYEDPRPHMTIGWTLEDVLSTDEKGPPGLRPDRRHSLDPDMGGPFRFRVGNVQCTPGRLIYDFPLK